MGTEKGDYTVNKQPKDWTLEEAKKHCESHGCENCPFWKDGDPFYCKLKVCLPKGWDLSEESKLTPKELEICHVLGATVATRPNVTNSIVDLWRDKPDGTEGKEKVASVSCELFPSIRRGDCVEIPERMTE